MANKSIRSGFTASNTRDLGSPLTPELTLEVFDEPIVCRRSFVPMTGDFAAALLLTYAVHATDALTGNAGRTGWFRRSTKDWMRETGLSETEIRRARHRLAELDLLEQKVLPGHAEPVVEYRVVPERLYELIRAQADEHWAGKV